MTSFSNNRWAAIFGINPARWKRWCREFLGHDPAAGLQSGKARKLNLENAFIVLLGGHLVSGLKFTIPDAKTIIQDILDWLRLRALMPGNEYNNSGGEKPIEWEIRIERRSNGFAYQMKGVLAVGQQGGAHIANFILDGEKQINELQAITLHISALLRLFLGRIPG